ncbi:MCE family protein [Mycolicibacterium vanbaalenii]|jgi:phospholipid/cholesterol/gamma-HCH transport system substrate-binding protein|uniref:Virulence factor Mce family protein n=1 Tax=Mycolicibacterium vanbaalenii (strain DSM 7251 / JCM 13017 / BCRC 16820 / KCTC 9966 / NRRL B-24157 / PYR-1) TaxID=350058 RepID=A1T910_MYCVP|nr:MCE family protein [Mycolicibacterium vanbaalenii]ABM13660.1 virulence factor Mce family protein [Mycolicibacterium vanbaalenii PYR-1]MCV7128415.1 MCE family protein [Mycolicibacterium vanbaalenii PYR-1]
MQKYRGSSLVRAGFIGAVLIALVIVVGLQPQQLWSMATSVRYQAVFAESGGLAAGNNVKVSGVTVGSVSDVELDRGTAVVTFSVAGAVPLGGDTTASIGIATVLGERVLVLRPAGRESLGAMGVIPLSRTGSPYSLTDAIGEFTSNTEQTDTAAINQSLDTLSDTIERIAPQLAPTFDGVTRLSKSLNSRNESLSGLLEAASDVTGVLSERSAQVNSLLLNANDLLAVLQQRRYAIVNLLASTTAVAQQLSGMVADNERELAPTLEKLNTVAEMLERNRDNITASLKGLAKYQVTQGEAVNNGFFYNGFASNLLPGPAIQPFLDYALGYRRGVDAGQPPDNAGPRAEFPFPYNGIPGGSR